MDLDPALQEFTGSDNGAGRWPEIEAQCFEFFEDIFRRCGCLGLFRRVNGQANRELLEALCRPFGKKVIRGHQGQNLVASVQRPLQVCRSGGVFARRLGNACEQRGFVRVLSRERLNRLAEIKQRGRSETVSAIAEIDETAVAREQFLLGLVLGSVVLLHLSLKPERKTHLLNFPQELVRGGHPDKTGQETRDEPPVLWRAGVFFAVRFWNK